jgi:hypothetical protein
VKKTMLVVAAVLGLVALASAQDPPASMASPEKPALSSKVWIEHYAEYEEFLKTAPIERLAAIPVGVTHPRRAYFAPGGLAASAAVKNLPPGRRAGFWESYKSEIAAYELDRLLGLDMVPPTVERRVEGDLVSVQLWVEARPSSAGSRGTSSRSSSGWRAAGSSGMWTRKNPTTPSSGTARSAGNGSSTT